MENTTVGLSHLLKTLEEISKEAVNFFSNIYQSQVDNNVDINLQRFNLPKLSSQQLPLLQHPSSDSEIKEAIVLTHSDRPAGPDGFSIRFFNLSGI